MSDLHAKPEQQSERLVASEQVMTRTFNQDKTLIVGGGRGERESEREKKKEREERETEREN